MSDPATLAFYDENAPRYTMSFGQTHSRQLDAFLDLLEPGARVLELGCGGGRDGQRMIERGFDCDMTDGSRAMVRKAQERTSHPARLLRFDQLEADAGYDAVWAHASLHHQPMAGLGDILSRIHRALKPGGLFFANYKLGTGEARDQFGRLYNFPPRADLLALYPDECWMLESVIDYRDGGLDKVLRDWIALTARKR